MSGQVRGVSVLASSAREVSLAMVRRAAAKHDAAERPRSAARWPAACATGESADEERSAAAGAEGAPISELAAGPPRFVFFPRPKGSRRRALGAPLLPAPPPLLPTMAAVAPHAEAPIGAVPGLPVAAGVDNDDDDDW